MSVLIQRATQENKEEKGGSWTARMAQHSLWTGIWSPPLSPRMLHLPLDRFGSGPVHAQICIQILAPGHFPGDKD